MKSQEELHAEFERLMVADKLEEASAVLDQIEPISDEEWLARVHAAPEVDEPVPTFIIERSRVLDAIIARRQRQVG